MKEIGKLSPSNTLSAVVPVMAPQMDQISAIYHFDSMGSAGKYMDEISMKSEFQELLKQASNLGTLIRAGFNIRMQISYKLTSIETWKQQGETPFTSAYLLSVVIIVPSGLEHDISNPLCQIVCIQINTLNNKKQFFVLNLQTLFNTAFQ